MLLTLDHIVHLSRSGGLSETVSQFQRLGFHVIPGGVHADGLTENALVVLADGVYLELLQFRKPLSQYSKDEPQYAARRDHWWGSMKEGGWIDFALGDLTRENDATVAEEINQRARERNLEISYDAGREGGRVKPDGDRLRWLVTFPSSQHLRGSVPFFCKDLTPREKRVPLPSTDGNNESRIAALTLMTMEDTFTERSAELSAVFGSDPTVDSGQPAVWKLDSPETSQSIQLRLIPANTEPERSWIGQVGGIGLWEVEIRAGPKGSPDLMEMISGLGRIKWVNGS